MTKYMNEKCHSEDAALAYLYQEMAERNVVEFEAHLVNCEACTGQLAELSLSRLDVFEWRKVEFDALPTPPIRIPYEPRSEQRPSLLTTVWRFWQPLAAAGAFAAILLTVGLALLLSNGDRSPSVEISHRQVTSPPADPQANVELPDQVETAENIEKDERTEINAASSRPRPRKEIRPRRTSTGTARVARTNVTRLADFDEDADETLRLSDLLASTDGAE